ncbi:hypothetical protein BDU57DRAFT_24929 [Ampelomyces quisqualis]|uniref:Uncharacterized protein n=1 Tax=Ampelomyces quisqualis TaxID=50730 RepID=A0A6A5R1V9_AMPQU|nr:hypothetical protein BDU57DRAFT_24929 [Ampelomyces quisqualis]
MNATVENIREAQHQVKSNVTPLTLLSWDCPVYSFLEYDDATASAWPALPGIYSASRYKVFFGGTRRRLAPRKILKDAANGRTYLSEMQPIDEDILEVLKPGNLQQLSIYLEDSELLHFLIAMGEDHTSRRLASPKVPEPRIYRFDETDFLYAARLGRVELLKEIIVRTGAGILLDDLVRKVASRYRRSLSTTRVFLFMARNGKIGPMLDRRHKANLRASTTPLCFTPLDLEAWRVSSGSVARLLYGATHNSQTTTNRLSGSKILPKLKAVSMLPSPYGSAYGRTCCFTVWSCANRQRRLSNYCDISARRILKPSSTNQPAD